VQSVISLLGKSISVDLNDPIDISIPLRAGEENVNAFYIPPVRIEPFRMGNFTGDVNQGGSCNVNNIFFNPHGNGTHTESVGHISKEPFTINRCLKKFFFIAKLITVLPEELNGDKIITKDQLLSSLSSPSSPAYRQAGGLPSPDALIIRTFPNPADKMIRKYSGTNPPYLHHVAAQWMAENGIDHLLIDLPSVDREDDDGKLMAHHAFWQYPAKTRTNCTITELIYVPDTIPDGTYLLNIQIASFENDASPSKPVLYKIR